MNIQAAINEINAQWQRERAETQMTLGKMVAIFEGLPQDKTIEGITNPHSYRGYYCDLAFEPANKTISVAETLLMCRESIGSVQEGYKGGEFKMSESTPVWIAMYGSCGKKIISLRYDGTFETAEDNG